MTTKKALRAWRKGFECSLYIRKYYSFIQCLNEAMASQKRFELPTDALEGRCSIQLSYWDTQEII